MVVAIVSIILTFIQSYVINMSIFAISTGLLIIGSTPKTWLKALKIFIPIATIGFSIFMSGLIWGADQLGGLGLENTQSGLNMLARFFSFAGLGLLLSLTTDSFELIKAMQKNGRIPRKFAYGLLAALNLLPHMKAEYHNAQLAFKVRGMKAGPLSTKVLFAMLVNCFRWSEMLAIAMYSKGFHED